MSYNLYLIATLGAPRNHHALFLETHPSTRSGIILNVVGNIQTGMAFEERRSGDPEAGDAFVDKTFLGSVKAGDVERVRGICAGHAAPGKQFEGGRRLFPGKVRRCREWTAETVGLLEEEGVLRVSGDSRKKEAVREDG